MGTPVYYPWRWAIFGVITIFQLSLTLGTYLSKTFPPPSPPHIDMHTCCLPKRYRVSCEYCYLPTYGEVIMKVSGGINWVGLFMLCPRPGECARLFLSRVGTDILPRRFPLTQKTQT